MAVLSKVPICNLHYSSSLPSDLEVLLKAPIRRLHSSSLPFDLEVLSKAPIRNPLHSSSLPFDLAVLSKIIEKSFPSTVRWIFKYSYV